MRSARDALLPPPFGNNLAYRLPARCNYVEVLKGEGFNLIVEIDLRVTSTSEPELTAEGFKRYMNKQSDEFYFCKSEEENK